MQPFFHKVKADSSRLHPKACSEPVCVCAMSDAADDRNSTTEEASASASTPPVSAAASSPALAASEPSSAGEAGVISHLSGGSELFQRIQDLQGTKRALKEQKKKCVTEMKNAMKRKKRLQGQASQLSDTDLVEVLRMRKARKDMITNTASNPEQHSSQSSLKKDCGTEIP